MALKGHTRIELTNVETGEVEVHEDNNMVTNALSKLLGNYGCFCNNPLIHVFNGTGDESVIKRLTGGLMLFDNEIEENPNIVNSPSGVSVVGCGSQTAYNGANTMAGSYNETESGWTDEGGYKHVWDFTTSQSNGNIACASLTTNAGGKITEGTYPNASDYRYRTGTNIDNEVFFLNGNRGFKIGNLPMLFADGINNRIIAGELTDEVLHTSKKVDLSFYRVGFTNFSIFDSPSESSKIEKIGNVTVDMPNELQEFIEQYSSTYPTYYWKYITCSDDNNIYFIIRIKESNFGVSANIEKGEQLHIWEINTDSFDSKYYSFVNNLDEAINFLYTTRLFAIANDYILCVGNSSDKYYLIKKENDLDISNPCTPDGEILVNSSDGESYIITNNGKFIVCNGYRTNVILKVVDPKLEYQLRYKNAIASNFFNYGSDTMFKVKGTIYWVEFYSGYLYLGIDPTLLVTINNLETPVQKTSAQTMKVTYVLTQE